LKYIYADGVKFKSVDGVATLEDSYLLDSSQEGVSSEEFFIHAKVTLPMFLNKGKDFVETFMDEVVGKRGYSEHNFSYFGITTKKDATGKRKIVKAKTYKYGKSKINPKSKPGEENKTRSIDEINQDINDAFERFENSRKDINSAKALMKKIVDSFASLRSINAAVDEKSIFNRVINVLLTNGIVTHIPDVGPIKYYNLKTKPYTSNGEYTAFKLDPETNEPILVFKVGDNLIDYRAVVSENGTLNLQIISDPVVSEVADNEDNVELDKFIGSDAF
jgi:hypothetical protein